MTFLPSKSDNEVVPFVEAHEKAGAFAPIVNAMAVEAIANMHGESRPCARAPRECERRRAGGGGLAAAGWRRRRPRAAVPGDLT